VNVNDERRLSECLPNWSFISNCYLLDALGRKVLTAIIKRKMWLLQTEQVPKLNRLHPLTKKLLSRN